MQEQHIWHLTIERLRQHLDPSVFPTWFQETRALSWQGEVFVVGVPTTFTKAHLELRYLDQIRSAINEVVGYPVHVQLVVSRNPWLTRDRLPAQFGAAYDESATATFLVVISKEASCYKATVLDVPECVAAGETRDEALQRAREALQTFVEMRHHDHVPVPEPQTTMHVLRLSLPLDQEQSSSQTLQETESMTSRPLSCSFCQTLQEENASLTTGPGGLCICHQCVAYCREMMEKGPVDFQQLKRALASRQPEAI